MTIHTTPGGSDVENGRGYTTLTVLDQPSVPLAAVRVNNLAMDALGDYASVVADVLPAALEREGAEITGHLVVVFYRVGGIDSAHAKSDVAIGFPIERPLSRDIDVSSDACPGETALHASTVTLPEGRIAALSHNGPYSTRDDSWNALLTTLTDRGLEPTPPFWEVSIPVAEQDTVVTTSRTDLFAPLAPLN